MATIQETAQNVGKSSIYDKLQSVIASAKRWATAEKIDENCKAETVANHDNSPPPDTDFNPLLNALANVSTSQQQISVTGAIYDQQAFLDTINEINKQPSQYFNDYARSLTAQSLDYEQAANELEAMVEGAMKTTNSTNWMRGNSNMSAKNSEQINRLS